MFLYSEGSQNQNETDVCMDEWMDGIADKVYIEKLNFEKKHVLTTNTQHKQKSCDVM